MNSSSDAPQHLKHDIFTAAMNTLDSVVYVSDLKTYELLFLNRAGVQAYKAQTGRPCWETFQPGRNSPCPLCSHDKMLDHNGTPNPTYEWEYHNLETDEWYLCRDKAIRWHDGRMVKIEISTNITRQKKIELEHLENCRREQPDITGLDSSKEVRNKHVVRQSTETWEKTFDAMNDVITIQDSDMKIIKANQAAADLCSLQPKDLYGGKCYELLAGHTEPCPDCPIPKTLNDGKSRTKIIQFHGRKKIFEISASPTFDDTGAITGVVHVARDVTNQKKAEEEKTQLYTAINQVSETIIITDRNGTIQFANPAFEQLTGYSPAEAIGHNPRMLQSGLHDHAFYDQLWTTITKGKVWRGKITNSKKNGTLTNEAVEISPVFDDTGKISNFVAVKRDVTKETELEEQLRQSAKIKAIGTLAGGIAHDFNNILGIILGYAEIAQSEVANSQLCRDLKKIVNASERGTALVKQIQEFSMQNNQVLRPVKLQPVIKNILKMLRRSLPSTINLQENLIQESGTILADPTQIHQVLMNLCTNASDAMTDQTGTLKVSLKRIDLTAQDAGTPLHPDLKNKIYNLLEVTDNGCGMDKIVLEKIFDPFFTTREKAHGTGLGLSITYGIIRKHGGVITVDSELGHGTTCRVYLPTIKDNEQAKQSLARTLPTGNERIMLVDDEIDLVKIQQHILQGLGYSVTPFHDSIKALEAFLRNPNGFDLVITDMTMPELSGMMLTKRLKSVRPNLPVILCTGFSETINESQALAQGISYYLNKPVLKNVLAMTVRQVLDKAQE